jgi:hypothetical protein
LSGIVDLLQSAEKHRFVLTFFVTFLGQAKKVETNNDNFYYKIKDDNKK